MKARINRILAFTMLFCACIGFIDVIPYACKQQNSEQSIVDPYPSFLIEGTIQTIQMDLQGRLYIWLDSNRLIRINVTTNEEDFFLYRYANASPSRFIISNDEILFQDSRGIRAYDLDGHFICKYESKETFQCVKTVSYENTIYTVKRIGLIEKVWRITPEEEQWVYKRISYRAGMPIFIAYILVIVCIILFKRINKIKGSLILWLIDYKAYETIEPKPKECMKER